MVWKELDIPIREEQIQRTIDIAYRAEGFAEHLRSQGLIGKGNQVQEAVTSLLALETTTHPMFVIAARIEVADALHALLQSHSFDSGKRKYQR